MRTQNMKQLGVIVFGGGINYRWYVNDARKRGFVVVLCDGYATLWK